MQPTIYAAFINAGDAERAAGALMDHGIKPEDISLIVSEEFHRRQGNPDDPQLDYTHPHTVVREHDALNTLDPMNNQIRDTPVTVDMGVGRDLGPGNELLDAPLNPAQDDYPRSGTAGAAELSSAPPEAKRDFNPGLDKHNYNSSYKSVDAENEAQWKKEETARQAEALRHEPDEGLDVNRVETDIDDMRDVDRTVGPSVYDPERAAKAGVTTTTIEDAASAAKKGALFGLGIGALAAVAALAIPGYGLVVGGGALAAAAAGLAASAGAGAVAGGVVGYLKDQGVPAQDIPHYEKAITAGGAVLAVHLHPNQDRAHIENILQKYGAHATNDYGYAA